MSSTNPDRQPLWRAMEAAYYQGRDPGHNERHGYAAEIRAVGVWLLPEEPEPEPGDRFEQRHIIWRHNQRLRALLTAEADRAERGDG
jgi:hypothetical protein